MAEAIYTVTYVLFDMMLCPEAWQKTEPRQLRPVLHEILHMATPGLSVRVVQIDRDVASGHIFAVCKALVDIHEPDEEDKSRYMIDNEPFWLAKNGWVKLPVDNRIGLGQLKPSFA